MAESVDRSAIAAGDLTVVGRLCRVKRVAVVGSGGAGKSTLARELGQRTGIPVIHLDEHFWKPGWVATAAEEWRAVQNDLLAADCWIVDGNYGGTSTFASPGLTPSSCWRCQGSDV